MTTNTDRESPGLVEGSINSRMGTERSIGTTPKRRIPLLGAFIAAIVATTVFASVCAAEGPAECPEPRDIEADSRPLEYRYHAVHDAVQRKLPNTFIATTFSGGGMRAAALSFGALKALSDTRLTIPQRYRSGTGETTVPLINEVDFASSVSGGSVTAAYWALYGPRDGLDSFRKRFLDSNVRWEFTKTFTGQIRETIRRWFKKPLGETTNENLRELTSLVDTMKKNS